MVNRNAKRRRKIKRQSGKGQQIHRRKNTDGKTRCDVPSSLKGEQRRQAGSASVSQRVRSDTRQTSTRREFSHQDHWRRCIPHRDRTLRPRMVLWPNEFRWCDRGVWVSPKTVPRARLPRDHSIGLHQRDRVSTLHRGVARTDESLAWKGLSCLTSQFQSLLWRVRKAPWGECSSSMGLSLREREFVCCHCSNRECASNEASCTLLRRDVWRTLWAVAVNVMHPLLSSERPSCGRGRALELKQAELEM